MPLLIGLVLLSIGATTYLWTLWDFEYTGGGTPLPIDAPKKLVIIGLYRYIRNPMYVGVIMIILGWASVFTDWRFLIYALGVGIAVHLFVVMFEEPRLNELFGVEYESYRMVVGRWIPHFHGGKNEHGH